MIGGSEYEKLEKEPDGSCGLAGGMCGDLYKLDV